METHADALSHTLYTIDIPLLHRCRGVGTFTSPQYVPTFIASEDSDSPHTHLCEEHHHPLYPVRHVLYP